VRELRCAAEPAVSRVERSADAVDASRQQCWIHRTPAGRRTSERGELALQLSRHIIDFGAVVAVILHDVEQHASKRRPPVGIDWGKVGASEKDLALGGQKGGQRPPALARQSADRVLVAGVEIRPLVSVDFDRDEMFIDDLRHIRIVVAFVVEDVAPVAPDCPHVEQDGFVLLLRAREGFC